MQETQSRFEYLDKGIKESTSTFAELERMFVITRDPFYIQQLVTIRDQNAKRLAEMKAILDLNKWLAKKV